MTRDNLTKLLNREVFNQDFDELLTDAKQKHQPLTIASVDLDHFLHLNQDYGHAAGDEVLKGVAEEITRIVDGKGKVYRVGGDEFVVLFPNTLREQAFLVMEKVRSAVEEKEQYGEHSLNIKVSGGIASFPIDGNDTAKLWRKADQALYKAKLSGANQIRLAYDERMVPKTTHFTETQLERLTLLSDDLEINEARLLREALDDLLNKYKDRG